MIVESHFQVVKHWGFALVATRIYQPKTSVFYDPGIRLNILQIAPLILASSLTHSFKSPALIWVEPLNPALDSSPSIQLEYVEFSLTGAECLSCPAVSVRRLPVHYSLTMQLNIDYCVLFSFLPPHKSTCHIHLIPVALVVCVPVYAFNLCH